MGSNSGAHIKNGQISVIIYAKNFENYNFEIEIQKFKQEELTNINMPAEASSWND